MRGSALSTFMVLLTALLICRSSLTASRAWCLRTSGTARPSTWTRTETLGTAAPALTWTHMSISKW